MGPFDPPIQTVCTSQDLEAEVPHRHEVGDPQACPHSR
jgi:hypothetical protein